MKKPIISIAITLPIILLSAGQSFASGGTNAISLKGSIGIEKDIQRAVLSEPSVTSISESFNLRATRNNIFHRDGESVERPKGGPGPHGDGANVQNRVVAPGQ
ncbi:MAG: hypothetical protein NVS2B14_11440 [Chamaesiphon sp.]